jgi:hypothetical protein
VKQDQFCAGEYLANRAADGLAYPEQAPLRWESLNKNREPEDEPAPLPPNAWATLAPLTFHEAVLRIVRSQHHINTENL